MAGNPDEFAGGVHNVGRRRLRCRRSLLLYRTVTFGREPGAIAVSSMEEIVSRPQFTVRRVTPELEPDFTVLWATALLEAGATPAARPVSKERVAVALARDDVHAYLASAEGQPVGYVVLIRSPLSFMSEASCVSIDQIFVVPEARRSGAARALLSAAATYADRLGADHLACAVPAQVRDANRFFVRLGFSPDVVRRVTTTSALRRKLATGDEPHPGLDRFGRGRLALPS
jgi:GNAT superfamily N-acetyltransferase